MIELEITYLAKSLPDNLKNSESREIIDIYIPKTSIHPKLRLRKNGNKFRLTKKEPVDKSDASHQEEQTIVLTKNEFNALNQQIKGKRVRKIRYYYKYQNKTAEFDVFQDNLLGLVVVEFEFKAMEDKNDFPMPDFCLADVTQEEFIAGGMICGKTYQDIKNNLNKFNYKKIFLK